MNTNLEQIRIGSRTRPGKAAGFIIEQLAQHGAADVRAIGQRATNQSVKAIAIARDMAAEQCADIVTYPEFVKTQLDGKEFTALRFYLVAVSNGTEEPDE